MNTTKLQHNLTDEYCFPDSNNSCKKEVRNTSSNIFLCLFLSCISVVTVLLNLLVIISISHFKQLHTPTNLLIMSLAVADLLVGLVVMPVNILDLIDNCWYLGKTMCAIYPVVNYISVSASAGSLVFIAVDRYVALNNPLLYSTKVTICKASLFIVLTWFCAILYNTLFYLFVGHLLNPDLFSKCIGECVVVQSHSASMADLFISFLGPCSAMLFFYLRIFKVVRYQLKSITAIEYDNTRGSGVKRGASCRPEPLTFCHFFPDLSFLTFVSFGYEKSPTYNPSKHTHPNLQETQQQVERQDGLCHRVTQARLPQGQRQEIAFDTDNILFRHSRRRSNPPHDLTSSRHAV
ncbi:Trace amine-associated receptor 13c [Bagarius yarrelli]|uniref:Trace amine-associated receptor 13c n=1 Tax=Bagarius yarrelli TaxID=175774 RepID=A0A556V567_BAGYA|nr:Trace amine-associated receptor 13c [Bagarius yarrelli]